MTELDIVRICRRVIRQDLSASVLGQITANESATRVTAQRYSNESPFTSIRSIQPFGLSSKAQPGTPALFNPAGFDPSNQNVIGHFDEAKPDVLDGETCLYNAFGQAITLSNGRITIGQVSDTENMVLGLQLKTLLTQLLEFIAQHTHAGIGVPPSNASDFESLKSNIDKILSQISFTG